MKKGILLAALILCAGICQAQDFSVVLSWAPATGATGYDVYRTQMSGLNYQLITTTPVTGTSYQDGSVIDGQTYYYVVVSVDATGASPNSNEVGVLLPTLPPAATQIKAVIPALKGLAINLSSTNSLTSAIETFLDGTTQNITSLTTIVSGAAPPPPPPVTGPSATFIGKDTTTHGTWLGAYGKDAYTIAGNNSLAPSYGSITETLQSGVYTWVGSSSDSRALQYSSGNGRIAACWYSMSAFDINVTTTDSKTHKLSIYAVDWDSSARAETITVLNAATGAVLDTEKLSLFNGGVYLSWNITGNVKVVITFTAGANAAVSGVFLN